MTIAKLFNSGGSQAVRLPKEFRMSGTEVSIRKVGHAVVIEPLTVYEWTWLDEVQPFDPAFEAAVAEKTVSQVRQELDDLFS